MFKVFFSEPEYWVDILIVGWVNGWINGRRVGSN